MAVTQKHVLIAGLGRYVSAAYEVGAKLGIEKSNKQIVLDVSFSSTPEQTSQNSNNLPPRKLRKRRQQAMNALVWM
jgi:hypothetical protein